MKQRFLKWKIKIFSHRPPYNHEIAIIPPRAHSFGPSYTAGAFVSDSLLVPVQSHPDPAEPVVDSSNYWELWIFRVSVWFYIFSIMTSVGCCISFEKCSIWRGCQWASDVRLFVCPFGHPIVQCPLGTHSIVILFSPTFTQWALADDYVNSRSKAIESRR